MRTQVKRAFTLIEILIVVVILGILAAIVIPQFTDASQQASTSSLQSQLQTIRSQVELFRVKNNGTDPDLSANWNALVLTNPPYLHSNPKNPLISNAAVAMAIGTSASTSVGWTYHNNAAGVKDVFAVSAAGVEMTY